MVSLYSLGHKTFHVLTLFPLQSHPNTALCYCCMLATPDYLLLQECSKISASPMILSTWNMLPPLFKVTNAYSRQAAWECTGEDVTSIECYKNNLQILGTQWKFTSHLHYSPVSLGWRAVLISGWVSCTQLLKDPGCFCLRMLPYLHLASKVMWERKEIMKDYAEDFMSRPRCCVPHSCPLLSHRAPNLLQKKLGNVAPRGKCRRVANSGRSLSLDDCFILQESLFLLMSWGLIL